MSTPVQKLFDLSGKTALITGGSRGLGLQIAHALGEAGAKVMLSSRKAEDLEQAAAELQAAGIDARWIAADCAKEDQTRRLADETVERMGPVDILVNNAGASWGAPAEEHPVEAWDKVMNLNVRGYFILSQQIARNSMIPGKRGGRIVNIASISALIVNRGIGGRDYETGKAAVLHFTRCAAADWAPHGITVNAICPGLFMTDINRQWNEKRPDVIEAFVKNVPMGRPGEPEEIGPLAVFLASPAASYITGAAYVIDGGYTVW